MRRLGLWLGCSLVVVGCWGCAHAARDTTGFAIEDATVVDAPFEVAWQATKAVLREMDFEIYTRDKRGTFVAYTAQNRSRFLVPHRSKLTIELDEVSASATRVTVVTIDQVYGVTLLTYPDWHDRKAGDNSQALAVLEGIKAKLTAG